MLRNLKLWQKLGLLSLAFVIPTLVLVVLLRQEKNLSIDFAEKESAGNHYLGGLKSVLEGLPLYGMTGDSGAAAKVEGGFKRPRRGRARSTAPLLNTSQRLTTLKDQWQKTTGSASPQDRAARTEQLIQSVVDTFAYVGDTSNLILDPDLDSYYTMEAVVRHSVENQRNIYGVVKMVQTLPTDRAVNPQERMQLLVQLGQLRQGVDNHRAGMAKGASANPGGQLAATRPGLEAHSATSAAFADRVTRNVVDRGDSGAAPSRDGIEDAAERALAASVRSWDDASKALQGMLDARISAATNRKYLAYGITAQRRARRRADRLADREQPLGPAPGSGPHRRHARPRRAGGVAPRGRQRRSRSADRLDEPHDRLPARDGQHGAEGVRGRPRRQREPALQERRVRRRVPRHGRLPREHGQGRRTASPPAT